LSVFNGASILGRFACCFYRSDAWCFHIILLNILDVAIKFTDDWAGNLTVKNFSGAKGIAFIVSDTVIGIPKAHLSMIFNRFNHID